MRFRPMSLSILERVQILSHAGYNTYRRHRDTELNVSNWALLGNWNDPSHGDWTQCNWRKNLTPFKYICKSSGMGLWEWMRLH